METSTPFCRWRRGAACCAPTVALLIALATPASAQMVRLHVLADSVTVGERFGVAVAVEHGPGVQVVFPEPPGAAAAIDTPLRAGEAELLGGRRLPPTVRGGTRVDSVVFEAAAFELDSARVGPVSVRIVRGTDTTTVASPAVFVGVRSLVPADAEEPHGLAPLADFPRAWGPWLLAALAVLALGTALWWWLHRRRNRPVPTSARPPDEEVLHRLGALAAALPTSPADVKPFYVELSDALRTYLARTLGVPAREQTTHELLSALARRPDDIPDSALEHLSSILRLADLAKFASVQPDAEAHETALARAREAVAALVAALEAAQQPEEPEPADA